ncbi:M61 family metallopeptidase [Sphingomonas sinipercae]|uniref:M61 family metallopeptidase n=2 Tax=Sphingomonas sinipercae TaxID=2714944 RepID=A0A6G7ZQQ4_9SPHN|nr:M61 family metallopeptidase [Sphingomonas sinipercae]
MPVAAQRQPSAPPVEYALSFDNAVHNEARITVTYRAVRPGPMRYQMSRSSPGRYALHEFAKNVYAVSASDGAGRPLAIIRSDPYGWTVLPSGDGTVRVTYTLYADRGDGTYAQIDPTHAHLNMPATLMWATGYDDRPVTVRFKPFDASWKVATQLFPTADPFTFQAPNFQYLMDSPAELSDFDMRSWTVPSPGGPRTIRLAVHHEGTAADVDKLMAKTQKVVAQEIAVFGAPAPYDTGTYTFIVDAMPQASGDGMEHRNSTIVSGRGGLAASDYAQLGTISHEFFHSWNVERLRPRELEPFDFTRANPTPSLWFAEGFTTYYGPLFIRRAGESSTDRFLQGLAGTWNYVANGPGRSFGSPLEMSLRAPFVDAATSVDPTTPNIITNYYPYGAAIGLSLDLMLRQRGLSLDGFMRHMWLRNGVNERPFTTADLERGLAEFTRDPAFASDVFTRFIRGSALPDLAPLLAQAGLSVRPANPGKAFAGDVDLTATKNELSLDSATQPGSPLYIAGIERGDRLLSVAGAKIESKADWDKVLAKTKPGQSVAVRFVQRGHERTAMLTFVGDPTVEIVRDEAIGKTLSPAQQAFRTAWLGAEPAPAK